MLSFQLTLLVLSGYISLSIAQLFELTPINIEDTISNGIWLIEYFSLSCPHAETFAPIWRQLSNDYEADTMERNINFGTIDCTTFGDLCTKYGIDASPTIQLFENGEFKEVYSGPKNYDELTGFIYKKLNLPATFEDPNVIGKPKLNQDDMLDALVDENSVYKEQPNPRGVSISIDGEGLDRIIRSHEYWFVKFYSPSCPHCIALGPTWSQMASELRNQVNVAEVNCEALPSVCRQNSIPYVPLLRLYGGRSPLEYHGDRSLKSLVYFAKSNSSIKNQNYVRHYIREIDVNALDLHSTGHEQTPLVTHIDINNSDLITNDNRKLVIHLVDETNIMDHSKFYEIASHWPKLGIDDTSKEETDVIFAEVELSQLRYFMQPESEVTGESNPQIIIVDNLKSEYYLADQNQQLFSMDKPENIYNALDNLESLTGRQFNFIGESNTTTLDNEYSISSLRVFVVMIVFTIAAFIVQKYHTVYTPTFSKKYEVLPSYQTIGYSAYKN